MEGLYIGLIIGLLFGIVMMFFEYAILSMEKQKMKEQHDKIIANLAKLIANKNRRIK